MHLPSPENPITVTLEVTSVNQLLNLWHRLNVGNDTVKNLAEERGFDWQPDKEPQELSNQPAFRWWKELDNIVTFFGLEGQL